MKLSCNIIRDLMPLYIDGVCSEESKKIVKDHLEECKECQAYFVSMNEENKTIEYLSNDDSKDSQKISSFKAIKKRIRRKQVISGLIAILVAVSIFMVTVGILKNIHRTVEFKDNISVSMVDGNLMGRLYGSNYTNLKIKNIEVIDDEKISRYIFYCICDTLWDDISTSEDMMTEYVICPKEKSADIVDRVYYYSGDLTGIESMNDEELQKVIENSRLLWEK